MDELRLDFPELYVEKEDSAAGREFLTDGKVCFYYDYVYFQEELPGDMKINRIVLNGRCGSEYRIGQLPGNATYADEYIYLTDMGYEFLYRTEDIRHFWRDEEGHLIIVTRGMWAGSVRTDYSMVISEAFWE